MPTSVNAVRPLIDKLREFIVLFPYAIPIIVGVPVN